MEKINRLVGGSIGGYFSWPVRNFGDTGTGKNGLFLTIDSANPIASWKGKKISKIPLPNISTDSNALDDTLGSRSKRCGYAFHGFLPFALGSSLWMLGEISLQVTVEMLTHAGDG